MSFIGDLLPEENEGNRRIHGVTTGIVTENWDEKHPGMVKVEIHMGENKKNITGWVRVMQPYASKECGFYMLPEIGSEVLIAFNMGDVNRPYVIGGLWNNVKKVPKETAVKENKIKKIVTAGGNEIKFDDNKNKENIEIKTPKELKILVDDEKQCITIQDKKGENLVKVDAKGGEITINAKNKVSLGAGKGKASLVLDNKGNATLSGTKITLNAKQQTMVKGQTIKVNGTNVAVEGKAGVNVKSSAILQLKGSITKIN